MKLLVLLVVAGVSGSLATTGAVLVGSGSSKGPPKAASVQQLVIYITGKSADHVRGSNIVVASDRPVRLTIVNRSPLAHTFSVPDLAIDKVVLPARRGVASTTIVTFTPHRGVFSWLCRLPCGDMKSGHMGGLIYALQAPPAMHGTPWAQSI